MRSESPQNVEAAAELLRAANDEGRPIRFVGGGTKATWGKAVDDIDYEFSTTGMNRIIEHNSGDLTTVVEAGLPFATLRESLAESKQMLALDAFDAGSATIGGIVATGDSGPLRHRYGPIRDLVLGVTVVLANGTIAKSGGKVIKNVAGYDLGKLFSGSFGTLGLIGRVALRLHPKPPLTATLVAATDARGVLQDAAIALAAQPLELESLDVNWSAGSGNVLARWAGSAPRERAQAGRRSLEHISVSTAIVEDDASLWDEQRRAQRSEHGVVLKVSGLPTAASQIVAVASSAGASLVGRAGLGLYWLTLTGSPGDLVGQIEETRSALAPWHVVVTDAPEDVRRKVDVWGASNQSSIPLMQRIKEGFDPRGICNRGIFVAGL